MGQGTVAIFHQYAYSPASSASTRHHEIGKRLAKAGIDVTIIAGSFDHKRRTETKTFVRGQWHQEEVIEGVRYIWLKTLRYRRSGVARLLGMAEFFVKAIAWTRSSRRSFDAALGSSPSPFAAAAALAVARMQGKPFVLEIRDIWPETLVGIGGMSRWHPVYLVLRGVERVLYRQANSIISTLPKAADHIRSTVSHCESISFVPNGAVFDTTWLKEHGDRTKLPAGLRDAFLVCHAGALGLSNDPFTILKAAQRLQGCVDDAGRPIHFVFYGGGELLASMREWGELHGLGNVHYLGFFEKSAVFSTLRPMDCFVAAVRDADIYRFGISLNKMNDYFAAARPIVLATNAAMDPVSLSGAGERVAAGDAEDLARAIRGIAGLPPTERAGIGMRGFEYGRSNHDFDILARQVGSILGFGDVPGGARRKYLQQGT